MGFIEELAAAWRACEQDYRERVGRMDLREVYRELRGARRMAAWCRMDGRGDGDIQYKIQALRARRNELGGGR